MRLLKTHDKLNKFGIPLGYTRVEYLESTGVQYIDTLWSPSSNDLRVKFKVKSTGNPNKTAICGAEQLGVIPRWVFILYGQDSDLTKTYPLTGDWNNSSQGFKFTSGTVLDIDWTTSSTSTTITDSITNTTYTQTFGSAINYTNNTTTLKLFQNTDTQKSSIQMNYYKILDNGVLVRDFIPCLDLLGKPCLYDLVGQKTYYNLGSGADFTYGRKIIPVEYLESTGEQYIDTGIVPTSSMNAKIDFYVSSTSPETEQHILGSMGGSGAKNGGRYQFLGFLKNAGDRWRTAYGDLTAEDNNWGRAIYDEKVHFDITLQNGISTVYINNSTTPDWTLTFEKDVITPSSIYMFALNNSGGAFALSTCRVYSCSISHNGTLLRDFIPCKDENNIGFMFDTLSGTVYENKGTGAFIIGEEVYDYKDTVRFLKDSIVEDLPRGYTRVEYIEAENSNGIIEYAVGNYRLTNTTDWEITFSASSTSNNWVFGQATWIGVHYRKDSTTGNIPKIGITNSSTAAGQCYVDYTDNEKITLALKGTDVYANGIKAGSITRESAQAAQTKYGIFVYKEITQALPNLRIPLARIYELKIWDNGVLVQHLVPVLDMNGEGCFCDIVNKTIIRKEDNCNSDFTTGSKVSSGLRLLAGGSMDDYIFLDYLESTGTQYIDTGIYGTEDLETELVCQQLQRNTEDNGKGIFGAFNSTIANSYYLYQEGSANSHWQVGFGAYSNTSIEIDLNKHTFNFSNYKVYMDGVVIANLTAGSMNTTPQTLLLFNLHDASGGIYNSFPQRFYRAKFVRNNTLIRNFLPVLKKSDNKPGMYDMVEGKFYVNQNTGEDFTYGYKQ